MIGAEADSALCKMCNAAVSLREGGPGLVTDHSPISSAEFESWCSYPSTPPRVFLKYISVKYSSTVHFSSSLESPGNWQG
jgi:hypothetical protein